MFLFLAELTHVKMPGGVQTEHLTGYYTSAVGDAANWSLQPLLHLSLKT